MVTPRQMSGLKIQPTNNIAEAGTVNEEYWPDLY